MTPQRARQLSTRWLVAGLVIAVVQLALDLVGIDLFHLPLNVALASCGAKFAWHSGWTAGHQHDRPKEQA